MSVMQYVPTGTVVGCDVLIRQDEIEKLDSLELHERALAPALARIRAILRTYGEADRRPEYRIRIEAEPMEWRKSRCPSSS